MTKLEEQALSEGTSDLIRTSGVKISLVRKPNWEVTDSGGARHVAGADTTLDPVRRFFKPVAQDSRLLVNWKGEIVETSHILVGPEDDEIIPGDTFTLNEREYEVIAMHPDTSFQVKAYVREWS